MVVEDSWEVGEDVRRQLTAAGFHVLDLIGSGAEAVRHARLERPDLVVMDLTLAEPLDGLTAAQRIRFLPDAPAVVCLTASADAVTVARACRVGASAYVVKPFQSAQLLSTIRVALANHQALAAERHRSRQASAELRDISERLDPMQIVSAELDRLSNRERDVVRLLAMGYRPKVIASRLRISYHTVKNHLKSTFKKLEVSSQAELIAMLRTREHTSDR